MTLEAAKRASTIAVYKSGDGFYFDALQDWLAESPRHQLVFFEEDQAFLESEVAKAIKNHPQAHVALLGDEQAYAILSSDFYFLSHDNAERIHARLLQEVYSVHAYLAELWLYKEQSNIYYHLAHLDEYSPSSSFKNSFLNSCFIICGAGPSLEKHLEELKNRKGILIGAGTALNILNDFGIQPDLGVAFDSKRTGSRRLQSNSAFSTPFLVDLDATEGVKYLSGSKILTKQARLAPWKDKLLSQLSIKEELMEIGPSVSSTHYAIESAIQLGALEIILLGVDLAYVKGKQYAGAKTWLLDEEDPVPIHERKDLIPLDTSLSASRIFLKEAEIFSALALEHPEVKFYKDIVNSHESSCQFIDLPHFDIPIQTIKKVLLEWKEELIHSPGLLLEGYLKRLKLKFAAKKRWMDPSDAISQFCKKVVDHHLHCLDEALNEIEEKIAYPNQEKPADKISLDATVKLYYSNGQLKSTIDYANSKRNGIYRFFSRSGMLLEEGHYQEGFPIGQYKQWNRKGYLEKEIFLHPGGSFDLTEWDEEGNRIREIKSGHLFKKEVDALKESLDGLFKELP